MEQTALYDSITSAGFTVNVFEDHPQFFGNWRAHISRAGALYEVISDNREGWLMLFRRDNNQGSKVFEVESSRLSNEQQIEILKGWLSELHNTE